MRKITVHHSSRSTDIFLDKWSRTTFLNLRAFRSTLFIDESKINAEHSTSELDLLIYKPKREKMLCCVAHNHGSTEFNDLLGSYLVAFNTLFFISEKDF